MKQYLLTLVNAEHKIICLLVNAESAKDAREKGKKEGYTIKNLKRMAKPIPLPTE